MEAIKPILLRGIIYALTLGLGVAASAIAATGYATYDAATGMLDIQPISLEFVATAIGGLIFGNGLALTAVLKGWGSK